MTYTTWAYNDIRDATQASDSMRALMRAFQRYEARHGAIDAREVARRMDIASDAIIIEYSARRITLGDAIARIDAQCIQFAAWLDRH